METGMDDVKILIQRVDKICDFVNKMKKDYKHLKEGIKERDDKILVLENKVKDFEEKK